MSNVILPTPVCPFGLTPPHSLGHSWAAPTGVLRVTCHTKGAARFSELSWDQELKAFLPPLAFPNSPPAKKQWSGGREK